MPEIGLIQSQLPEIIMSFRSNQEQDLYFSLV